MSGSAAHAGAWNGTSCPLLCEGMPRRLRWFVSLALESTAETKARHKLQECGDPSASHTTERPECKQSPVDTETLSLELALSLSVDRASLSLSLHRASLFLRERQREREREKLLRGREVESHDQLHRFLCSTTATSLETGPAGHHALFGLIMTITWLQTHDCHENAAASESTSRRPRWVGGASPRMFSIASLSLES